MGRHRAITCQIVAKRQPTTSAASVWLTGCWGHVGGDGAITCRIAARRQPLTARYVGGGRVGNPKLGVWGDVGIACRIAARRLLTRGIVPRAHVVTPGRTVGPGAAWAASPAGSQPGV